MSFCFVLSNRLYGQELKTEKIAEVNILVDPPTSAGTKIIYPIKGGTITGKINGKFLPIGADFGFLISPLTVKADSNPASAKNKMSAVSLNAFIDGKCSMRRFSALMWLNPKMMSATNGISLTMVTNSMKRTLFFESKTFTSIIEAISSTISEMRISVPDKIGNIPASELTTRLRIAASLRMHQPKKNNQLMRKPAKGPNAAST